jgi:hypothetical protein
VRKLYLPLSFICLLLSFLLLPVVKAGSHKTEPQVLISSASYTAEVSLEAFSNILYDSLNLSKLGLSREAMLYAYRGQQNLIKKGKLSNSGILTVCDFSKPSDSKRMYILDVKNFKVLLNTYVAHGKNSGLKYAEKFSNRPKSLQSSLGFYVTKNTYIGEHGLSLRLAGLDKGFNDRAESRAVVVHGAGYIGDEWLGSAYMGRSYGCPAVPQQLSSKVINLIKNGTCLFIYHPSKTYLRGSKILNG